MTTIRCLRRSKSWLSKKTIFCCLPTALGLLLPLSANAINGMYLTGYGAESVLMGGADVAVARGAFAANNNPAGMAWLSGRVAEFELVAYDNMETAHSDSFGNYRKSMSGASNAFANAGYAQHIENSPFSAGAALIVQGGIGWTYSGLSVNTALGGAHRDDASSLFAVIKFAPAIAWKVNDRLSLGVTLGINYLGGSQEIFPNTAANPSPGLPLGFNGFRFKGASGIGLNSKWGMQYRPADAVTIGVTYGTQTSVPMKNGNMRINFSNLGLGTIRYENAKLEGFRLPEELAVGISFRPAPPLLISLQDKWYNWSKALNTLTLTATSPQAAVPAALSKITIPSALDFSDQHVIEIGLAYDYDKDATIMAGINHGSRPIPDRNVSPIFSVIPARHYMLGVARKLGPEWTFIGGMELFTMQSVTYDSPIFGPQANERVYATLVHLSLERRW